MPGTLGMDDRVTHQCVSQLSSFVKAKAWANTTVVMDRVARTLFNCEVSVLNLLVV